jgi:hypothetical protein
VEGTLPYRAPRKKKEERERKKKKKKEKRWRGHEKDEGFSEVAGQPFRAG